MTAAELHARAVWPGKFVLLGQRLVPLALGHVAHMRRLGCYDPKNPADLVLAIICCSRGVERIRPFFESRLFNWRLKMWGAAIGKWDFPEKLAMFHEYIVYHSEMPAVRHLVPGARDGSPSVIPFEQLLATALCAFCGFDPATIYRVPYLTALWHYVTLAEIKARMVVEDYTEEDARLAVENFDEAGAIAWAEKNFKGRNLHRQ